ncbi:MAG: nucleotidyltransferase family protein [Oscillospiraceae bacterium]|jgi:predicted nucleotidyltransferase|nr:nucleotidyltransferase family protein [Oscillospiraceae bacterium]
MRLAAVIAEYNPFHAGHAYHLAETRKAGATHIAAVMSGACVQRGEFAIQPKHIRAKAALEGGADLVVTLPAPWSCGRAQDFANAAVHIIRSLGAEMLSFGSECGDGRALENAASFLETWKVEAADEVSFARARENALEAAQPGSGVLLRSPNDTLAIEYILACRRRGFAPQFLAVKRSGTAHDGPGSASHLRAQILSDCESGDGIYWPIRPDKLDAVFLYKLRSMRFADFAALPDVPGDLALRYVTVAGQADSAAEFAEKASCKSCTAARARRALLHAVLGVKKEEMYALPKYIQVLALNTRGQEILRAMKQNAAAADSGTAESAGDSPPLLPIISRLSQILLMKPDALAQFNQEHKAADISGLAMPQLQKRSWEGRIQLTVNT